MDVLMLAFFVIVPAALSLFIFVVGIDVLGRAARKNILHGLLCLFIPFFAPFYIFKNYKERFDGKIKYKIWAIIDVIAILACTVLMFSGK